MRFAWPLALFAVLVVLLGIGLTRDPRLVPSPLIGKAAPAFELPTVADPARRLRGTDLRGRPYLLNVWASWCVACRAEHPLLLALAKRDVVELVGLNYKDERGAASAWLGRHGNPYRVSLYDAEGRLGLDLGVYGVPETFLIDGAGVVRYKHVGPLDEAVIADELLPAIEDLGDG